MTGYDGDWQINMAKLDYDKAMEDSKNGINVCAKLREIKQKFENCTGPEAEKGKKDVEAALQRLQCS